MKILARLEKSKEFWFLIGICVIFFLLRLPSLFEPYWYGDEGIYEIIGYALRHGRTLYLGIWDNKPPLLYLIYALFDGRQPYAKSLSLVFGILSVLVFYFLAKKLFGYGKAAVISTSIFALLFALPLLEGNIANAENFILLPLLCAAYLIFSLPKKNNTLHLGSIGLLLGLAFLLKIVALFDLSAFACFILFQQSKTIKEIQQHVSKLSPALLGFLLPIFITSLYFLLHHAFGAFFSAVLTQNVGYVGYANHFIIPQGLLVVKTLILLAGIYFLWQIKTILTKPELFIYLWLLFSLFDIFFSERPYTHYVLMALTSLCLLFGLNFFQKAQKSKFIVLVVSLLLILLNFHFYQKPFSYYGNFLSFVGGGESVANYQSFFDTNTVRNYDITAYLLANIHKNDSLFLWGNEAQLYQLTGKLPPGRFTVAYHISAKKDYINETENVLKQHPPRFIVVFPTDTPYPFNLHKYTEVMAIQEATIYKHAD